MTESEHANDPAEQSYQSKSHTKREAEALQKLGTDLIKLTDHELKHIPLDDELLEAILLARRIQKKHEGFRRQLQFIGKLMRQRDPNPIQTALNDLKGQHQQATVAFHQLEQWRDRIIKEGPAAIDALVEQYPQANKTELLALYQEHLQQQQHNKPPMASRRIFVVLRKLLT